ncbi:hypothetical protein CEXT_491641 [Caerostris extrusa]|uniref:Uncharacterized protein n=1 Tax=Caerostris extrusa TaxID=172846 RepID=A0AAV4U2U4_CAEEX|nr:hypothetical protein CEXT_491641 [Caerostris extrusa]
MFLCRVSRGGVLIPLFKLLKGTVCARFSNPGLDKRGLGLSCWVLKSNIHDRMHKMFGVDNEGHGRAYSPGIQVLQRAGVEEPC